MLRRVVFSVGGSVIAPHDLDVDWLRGFGRVVDRFFEHGVEIALVAGGGHTARRYIDAVAELGGSKTLQDQAGILATALNSWLLVSAVKHAYYEPISDIWRALSYLGKYVPVLRGSVPGVTSDFSAALLAEAAGAVFVNITDVDGVYTKDPRVYPDAELIAQMTHDELMRLVDLADRRVPGAHAPVDRAAAAILARSRVKTYVVGKDLRNLRRLLEGKSFVGTVIKTP